MNINLFYQQVGASDWDVLPIVFDSKKASEISVKYQEKVQTRRKTEVCWSNSATRRDFFVQFGRNALL